MNKKRVVIIILNWNGWADTVECLESLYRSKYLNYNIIVVDNDSKDGSIEKIKSYAKGDLKIKSNLITYQCENKPIEVIEYSGAEVINSQIKEAPGVSSNNKLILIKNEKNYGFAEGNNIAIRFSLNTLNPDYVLLLNNDTVVDKMFLEELVESIQKDNRIGIVGPLTYYYDRDGRNDIIAFLGGKIDLKRYPGYHLIDRRLPEKHKYKDAQIECDWISGAALMMNTRNIPIKFLNSEFFFGCEDIDLCINLKEYGYKMVVVLSSKIWHKVGVSRKKRYPDKVRGAIRDFRTGFKFLKLHNKLFLLYFIPYIVQINFIVTKSMLKKLSHILSKYF